MRLNWIGWSGVGLANRRPLILVTRASLCGERLHVLVHSENVRRAGSGPAHLARANAMVPASIGSFSRAANLPDLTGGFVARSRQHSSLLLGSVAMQIGRNRIAPADQVLHMPA